MMNRKIAFIGVGNMASAIISGITSREHNPVLWSDIVLYNRHSEKIQKYGEFGAFIADSLEAAIEIADCVMLCVKPQNFQDVLPAISKCKNVKNKLFVSIAAGIATKTISEFVDGAAIVRVMPNTPMIIGKGVSAISRNHAVSDDDFTFVCDVFSSAGRVIVISEEEMNRIICVTGSSPAYVFMLIKAMCDGAAAQGLLKSAENPMGLEEKDLIDSICDTIIGSAELMKAGNKTPDEQISTVASKGGTTERALSELEKYRFCEAISSAMEKCTQRADELSSSNN